MFLLVLLGLGTLGVVIYMAVSRKSPFMVRIVALGALALMILAVIICLLVFFKTGHKAEPVLLPDMLPSDIPPPAKDNNVLTMVMFVFFMIALFVVVLVVALREQRRNDGKEVRPDKGSW